MIQGVLAVQSKYSRQLDASEIMPHPTTVSRRITEIAEKEGNDLSETLKVAVENGMISLTSDMWTDGYKQRPYLTITAHWITTEWMLKSQVPCTEEFEPLQKKMLK